MNYEELLTERYFKEVERLKLLKGIKLEFSSVDIYCREMVVSDVPSIKKKGYEKLPLYQQLKMINGPVVYYYEFKDSDYKDVLKSFSQYKAMGERNCSALPKGVINIDTTVLYVGSESKSIARRTMEHMGYSNPGTGGLQISKWAPSLSLRLKLHFASLDEEKRLVLEDIETVLAKNLKPLIGKHKV